MFMLTKAMLQYTSTNDPSTMNGLSSHLGNEMERRNKRYTNKGCLNDGPPISVSVETKLILEKQRLQLLLCSLSCKRAVQSLRVRGLKGLDPAIAKVIIQSAERRATLIAVQEKKKEINKLQKEVHTLRKSTYYKRNVDQKMIDSHKRNIDKKLKFFEKCEDTKWAEWNAKRLTNADIKVKIEKTRTNRKKKRKRRAMVRKCRKKERLLIERAEMAIRKNLVVNLSNIDVPLFSIAILSYGPGWIPSPRPDLLRFKIDGLNIANKLSWAALFKDKASESTLPPELLKNEITPACSTFADPVIKQVKTELTDFAKNAKIHKPKQNLNCFEREGDYSGYKML